MLRQWLWVLKVVVLYPYELFIYRGDWTPRQVTMFHWWYLKNPKLRRVRPGVRIECCDYKVRQVKEVWITGDSVECESDYNCSLFHCGVFVV